MHSTVLSNLHIFKGISLPKRRGQWGESQEKPLSKSVSVWVSSEFQFLHFLIITNLWNGRCTLISSSISTCFKAGVPNLLQQTWYQSGPVRNQAAQQEVSLNVMSLNHPETNPSVEKLSSVKLVPGAKKVGGCCFKVKFVMYYEDFQI